MIGGGTMGSGIATSALLAGLAVTMLEMSPEAGEAARGRIEGNLSGALKRGKIDQAGYEAMTQQALSLTTSYDDLSAADLIIEAVFEDMDVKKAVFTKLDAVANPGPCWRPTPLIWTSTKLPLSRRAPKTCWGCTFSLRLMS